MSTRFRNIQNYHEKDPAVTVTTRKIGDVLISSIKEPSNDILIDSTRWNSVMMSVSGSRMHNARIGDLHRVGPVANGEVCRVPANVRMKSAWQTSGHLLHTISLEFDEGLFTSHCPEVCSDRFLQGRLQPATYHPNQPLSSLVTLMVRELDEFHRMGRLYSDGLLRLLAFDLATHAWSVPAKEPSHGVRNDKRIGCALDFIESNFRQDISVTDIAAAAGMSPTHLIDRFRAQIGQTPYSYVIKRRVEEAVRLLRFSDQPISHIAVDTGFADQQHLTRVMRERLGATPRTIRLGKDRA